MSTTCSGIWSQFVLGYRAEFNDNWSMHYFLLYRLLSSSENDVHTMTHVNTAIIPEVASPSWISNQDNECHKSINYSFCCIIPHYYHFEEFFDLINTILPLLCRLLPGNSTDVRPVYSAMDLLNYKTPMNKLSMMVHGLLVEKPSQESI